MNHKFLRRSIRSVIIFSCFLLCSGIFFGIFIFSNFNNVESTITTFSESFIIHGTDVMVPPIYKPESLEVVYINEILRFTNMERMKAGLFPFSEDDEKLNAVARVRAKDISIKYNEGHTRPNGESYAVLFRMLNVDCSTGGENIFAGNYTPYEVVTAWMNSDEHRINILNPKFTHLGIGVVFKEGGYSVYCTQEFKG